MMSPIKEIDLDDFTEAIPAFLTIVMMPFAYSIAEGIVFGMVSYVVTKSTSWKTQRCITNYVCTSNIVCIENNIYVKTSAAFYLEAGFLKLRIL